MDSGYWEEIPKEILEDILSQVPTHQLPLNKPWICKKWTEIVLSPRFWKMKLKKNGIFIDAEIWDVLQEHENKEIVACLYNASLHLEYYTQKTPPSDVIYYCQLPIFE